MRKEFKTSIGGKIMPKTLAPPRESMSDQKVCDGKPKKKKERTRICPEAIII